MDFIPLRLNSSNLTCSICALAAIILQLVAMEYQKLHMVDSSIDIPQLSQINFQQNSHKLKQISQSLLKMLPVLLGCKFSFRVYSRLIVQFCNYI